MPDPLPTAETTDVPKNSKGNFREEAADPALDAAANAMQMRVDDIEMGIRFHKETAAAATGKAKEGIKAVAADFKKTIDPTNPEAADQQAKIEAAQRKMEAAVDANQERYGQVEAYAHAETAIGAMSKVNASLLDQFNSGGANPSHEDLAKANAALIVKRADLNGLAIPNDMNGERDALMTSTGSEVQALAEASLYTEQSEAARALVEGNKDYVATLTTTPPDQVNLPKLQDTIGALLTTQHELETMAVPAGQNNDHVMAVGLVGAQLDQLGAKAEEAGPMQYPALAKGLEAQVAQNDQELKNAADTPMEDMDPAKVRAEAADLRVAVATLGNITLHEGPDATARDTLMGKAIAQAEKFDSLATNIDTMVGKQSPDAISDANAAAMRVALATARGDSINPNDLQSEKPTTPDAKEPAMSPEEAEATARVMAARAEGKQINVNDLPNVNPAKPAPAPKKAADKAAVAKADAPADKAAATAANLPKAGPDLEKKGAAVAKGDGADAPAATAAKSAPDAGVPAPAAAPEAPKKAPTAFTALRDTVISGLASIDASNPGAVRTMLQGVPVPSDIRDIGIRNIPATATSPGLQISVTRGGNWQVEQVGSPVREKADATAVAGARVEMPAKGATVEKGPAPAAPALAKATPSDAAKETPTEVTKKPRAALTSAVQDVIGNMDGITADSLKAAVANIQIPENVKDGIVQDVRPEGPTMPGLRVYLDNGKLKVRTMPALRNP